MIENEVIEDFSVPNKRNRNAFGKSKHKISVSKEDEQRLKVAGDEGREMSTTAL